MIIYIYIYFYIYIYIYIILDMYWVGPWVGPLDPWGPMGPYGTHGPMGLGPRGQFILPRGWRLVSTKCEHFLFFDLIRHMHQGMRLDRSI